MNEPIVILPEAHFKNRRKGLVVFGGLTVLLGLLGIVFVALIANAAIDANGEGSAGVRLLVPSLSIYGLISLALVWLGIGSMRMRRWSRALLLIFGWSWLVIGSVVGLGSAATLVGLVQSDPTALDQSVVEGPSLLLQFAALVTVLVVVFVLLPILWITFYGSRSVKATCSARDPEECWTDRCPLPVLAVCVWLVVAIPHLLLTPIVLPGVFPWFGTFLLGPSATSAYFLVAIFCAWAAWEFYQVRRIGWWVLILLLGVLAISHVVTYSLHDVTGFPVGSGFPTEQMTQMPQFQSMAEGFLTWTPAVVLGACLLYLIAISRFFHRPR